MVELFAVVLGRNKKPVCPNDHNPHPDQGCMVYGSREAAEASAKYQNENYGDDLDAIAVPVSEVVWDLSTRCLKERVLPVKEASDAT